MGKPYLCQQRRRTIGIGDLPGAFAEYIKVYPQMVIPIPEGVDSRNAALAENVPPPCTGSTSREAKADGSL